MCTYIITGCINFNPLKFFVARQIHHSSGRNGVQYFGLFHGGTRKQRQQRLVNVGHRILFVHGMRRVCHGIGLQHIEHLRIPYRRFFNFGFFGFFQHRLFYNQRILLSLLLFLLHRSIVKTGKSKMFIVVVVVGGDGIHDRRHVTATSFFSVGCSQWPFGNQMSRSDMGKHQTGSGRDKVTLRTRERRFAGVACTHVALDVTFLCTAVVTVGARKRF